MEQMSLFAPPNAKGRHVMHVIYQPENTPEMKPWAVSIEGWSQGKKTVTIYHESLNEGQFARFPNLKLKSPEAFADFVAKMLDVYITALSKPYIELRPVDILALVKGYEEGVINA